MYTQYDTIDKVQYKNRSLDKILFCRRSERDPFQPSDCRVWQLVLKPPTLQYNDKMGEWTQYDNDESWNWNVTKHMPVYGSTHQRSIAWHDNYAAQGRIETVHTWMKWTKTAAGVLSMRKLVWILSVWMKSLTTNRANKAVSKQWK